MICTEQAELTVTGDYACQDVGHSVSAPHRSAEWDRGKSKQTNTDLLAFSVPNLFLNPEWTSDGSEQSWVISNEKTFSLQKMLSLSKSGLLRRWTGSSCHVTHSSSIASLRVLCSSSNQYTSFDNSSYTSDVVAPKMTSGVFKSDVLMLKWNRTFVLKS